MSTEELRTVAADEDGQRVVIELVDTIRAATADFVTDHADPRMAMSMLATAAQMFSGALYGQLIAMGEMRDQDKRRAIDAAARNVRSGIEAGKRRGERIMRETAAGYA